MSTETPTAATPAPAAEAAAPAPADTLLTATPAQGDPAAPSAETPPATEAKPAEAKPEDKPQGAPEEYADFTMPEGVTLNAEAMTEFKAFAKEKGLTQEDAQKLIDLGAKNTQRVEAGYREQIEAVQTQWAEAARTDKEFGGDKLSENMSVAKKALDTFGSPELSKMLGESKLGNHPEIIRAFYRVGKAISEDRLVPGAARTSETETAKKLYPTMN